MKLSATLFIFLLLPIGCFSDSIPEWPNLYGPDYSSLSPTTVLKPPLKLKWVTRVFDNFKAGPVVAEGKVLCMGRTGNLFCLDAETGEIVWRFSTKRFMIPGDNLGSYSYGTRLAPRIYKGKAFVSFFWPGYPEVSGMYCFHLNTGAVLWKKPCGFVPGRARFSPAIAKDRLVFISNRELNGSITGGAMRYQAVVQAWDPITGDSVWSYPMHDTLASVVVGLAAVNDTIFASMGTEVAGISAGKTVALDGDGNLIWADTQHYVSDVGKSALAYYSGSLFIGNSGSTILLNASDGAFIRSDASGGYQAPVIMGNRYWRRTYGSSPRGYNLSTGINELSCAYTASVTGCGNPTAANGYLYLGHGVPSNHVTLGHALRAYDAVTGSMAWNFRMSSNGCTAPAIAYDRLYVTAGGDGDLVYCFENR